MKEPHNLQTVIIGSGLAAKTLAKQIKEKKIFGTVCGFINSIPTNEKFMMGIPILGTIDKIPEILLSLKIDKAIIALENADTQIIRSIFLKLKNTKINKIQILPDITRLRDAEAHLIQAREIGLEDLLGRDPVKLCLKKSLNYLRGKRVLVTGAGGSIGRELCRQLLYGGAQRLYLLDHSENNLYEIDKELRLLQEEGVGEKATIIPIIGELQDEDYLNFLLPRLKADVIFHTAAYKHVPLMEENPIEVIRNNLFGTLFLAKAIKKTGKGRLVLISTDKAVEPSCIYGASKLLAEQIILHYAKIKNQDFMIVRFGNVLGSQGSIVPLFKKQIEKGGPVTLTDPNIDRFFMTIPEAASLVLNAGGTGKSKNLYILDMGDPIKILEIANQMIRFYGYKPNKEIKIKIIGLRSGEKLHEKLWEDNQKIAQTNTEKLYQLENPIKEKLNIEALIKTLMPICFLTTKKEHLYRNRFELKKCLSAFFPQLTPQKGETQY